MGYKCHTTKPSLLDSEPPLPLPELPSCTKHHLMSNSSPPVPSPVKTTNSWPTSANTENPTEPSLNSCSEKTLSSPDTTRSRPSTLMPTTPTLLDTTSSPTRPSPRKKNLTVTPLLPESPPPSTLTNPPTPPPSTGDPRTLLPQSRTKLNAVHAGLSPPPVPLKALMPSRADPLNPSLSNNSSPAPSKTLDVTEDSWTTLSNTSSLPHSSSKPTTHTPPEPEEFLHALTTNPRVSVPSLLSLMSPEDPPPKCRPPFPATDQSPLPSKPIKWLSNLTPAVSSPPDVDKTSITVSSPSDTEPLTDLNSSSSRTPGVHHGEMPVTLELDPPPTHAVSSMLLPTHLLE